MSFNVELNDDGVSMTTKLFGVTPVMVYSQWTNYKGTCVWRCNQYSTYSLPGEPTDARWGRFWDDGIFAAGMSGANWTSPVAKLWELYRERLPDEAKQADEAAEKRNRWDSDTMMLNGAALTGGTVKRNPDGHLEIVLPKEQPRKKILGIF